MPSSCPSLLLLTSSTVSLALMLLFNALSGSGKGGDLFEASVSDQSDKYQTYITPAGWAFTIWTIIFLWLAVAQVFFIVTFFIRKSGQRMLHAPTIASSAFLGLLTLNYLLNLSWVFVADRSYNDNKLVGVASFILFAVAATNIAATAIFARNLAATSTQLSSSATWIYRILLNGFALYTTWCVIASLINLNQAIVFVPVEMVKVLEVWSPAPGFYLRYMDLMMDGSKAALSLLLVLHVAWFILENFVYDHICRWILTPYMVVVWASAAIYDKKRTRGGHSVIPGDIEAYVLSILVIAAITLVIRIGIVTYRSVKK